MAKTINFSSPQEGKGVFVISEIICKDQNAKDIKPFTKSFWLPKSSIKAAIRIRECIHINRIFDIPDSHCSKHITFIVKGVETTSVFEKIVKTLQDIGVEVEVKRE